MLTQGRSLSGNERNCCYLNLGASPRSAGRFANISAVSGLDYPDDGRGLVVLDWDHDGDLDLWLSNRNAPRLRLMRNDTPTRNHWVALRLVGNGTTCNRDAIGARVEVVLKESKVESPGSREKDVSLSGSGLSTGDTGPSSTLDSRPLIKTLRAGEGFLSQSSKWVHVGLGERDQIEKIVVRWPTRDDSVQEFTGLAVDQRYRLVQGHETAELVTPRAVTVKLTPSQPKVPPATDTARVPAVTLLKPPQWQFQDVDGRYVRTGAGRPVLVMLWASWCKPCLKEIKELCDRAAEIRQAGIEVVALAVDGLGDDDSDPEAARAMLERLQFPFVNAQTSKRRTKQLVANMQSYHDVLVRLDRPLPVPSSFLIDSKGFVSVMYRGRLSVDDLLADIGHTQRTFVERWLQAAPLPGRTIQHENILRTRRSVEASVYYRFASQESSAGSQDAEIYYLKQALRLDPESHHVHQSLGEIYFLRDEIPAAAHHYHQAVRLEPNEAVNCHGLGRVYNRVGKYDLALPNFTRAISLDPQLTDAYRQRAAVHYALGNYMPALEDCVKAIELEPQVAEAYTTRGQVYVELGNHDLAIRDFEYATKLTPDYVWAYYNLAWNLATCADPSYRSGERAVTVATRACELTGWNNRLALEALAAACAENGQFDAAIGWQTKAIELAPKAVAVELRSRLNLYRIKKPYHKAQ